MSASGDQEPGRTTLSASTIDLAIRLGFVVLLGYWSFRVIAPFLTIGLWSGILAVALYPLFEWLARRLPPRLAAGVVTVLSLIVVIGPVTWLALGMIGGIRMLSEGVEGAQPAIPMPPASVKDWPIVGERLHELWSLAANNMMAALVEAAPLLKPLGSKLLDIAQGALFS